MGPYKILAVGPCCVAETADGSPLGSNPLYLDPPSDLLGLKARRLQTLRQPSRQRGHAQIPTGEADAVNAQQFFQEVPAVPRHSRRRFDTPTTAGGGEGHWSSVGAGSRWRHRGAIQDTLVRTFRAFLGAENILPPLSPHILRYWARPPRQHP